MPLSGLSKDNKNIILAEKHMLEKAECFFSVMRTYVPAIIGESWRQMLPEVQWHFGEYLDTCENIF